MLYRSPRGQRLTPVEANAGLPANYKVWQRIIYAVSAGVCLLVLVLMTAPRPDGMAGAIDVSMLPTVNASFNALTMVLLVVGFACIKLRRIAWHKGFMLAAFVSSALFLTSYVTYHTFTPGTATYIGAYRPLYLVVLISHISLSPFVLPLALTTLFRGLVNAVIPHRKLAPYTLALWLYVSVTGVIVYFMAHT
jgi:putative membrane protein